MPLMVPSDGEHSVVAGLLQLCCPYRESFMQIHYSKKDVLLSVGFERSYVSVISLSWTGEDHRQTRDRDGKL